MAASFDDCAIEKLIELVRENEIIYNKTCRSYKNINSKAQCWQKIGRTLGKTEVECMGRWKSLRDKFTREYKSTKTQPSGSGSIIKPEWEFYKNLSFLVKHLQPRRTVSNVSSESSKLSGLTSQSEDSSQMITHHSLFLNNEDSLIIEDESIIENESIIEDESIYGFTEVSGSEYDTPNKRCKKSKDLTKVIGQEIVDTMGALKDFLHNKSSPKIVSNNFNDKVSALLNGLSDSNRLKAESKITEYLCKCQLQQLKYGDVDDIQM